MMDTLFIDADEGVVTLTWRASLALGRGSLGLDALREVVFGAMPPGWARARAAGKTYYRSLAELVHDRRAGIGSP